MPAAVGRTPVPPTAAVPPYRGRAYRGGAYRGREAVLATRHGKQVAVAPAMSVLGLRVSVPSGLDTDALGTFTGEVARVGTPVQAALGKARLGMAVAGCPLGLASEGSFGPLPGLPWLTADTEVLVFVDATLPAPDGEPLVVVETLTSLDTNAASCRVRSTAELSGFLARVGFPAVGLVVRPAGG
ncbi:MAG TPA: DUF6671 family protein, partial [Frankiaceae bacterium]|nr:DUF6671 family protein [Frankiaceae bacterium]